VRNFEHLPGELGNEILARLIVEMDSDEVTCIEELAAKHGQTTEEAWANLCEDSGAPLCTIPHRVMGIAASGATFRLQ
jgi:hypothetical protein